MSYIKAISESFGEEYQNQLSAAIIAEMESRFNIDEEIAAINETYKLELDEAIKNMSDDELEVGGADMEPNTVSYDTVEDKFNFCLELMKKRGMTVTHDIDKKGIVTIRTYDMVTEAKYKTEATYDVSVKMLERNELEK